MAKLEVVLKQNTPIIHFQYDQAGATIRGSELKPRLDEFLRKHAFDDEKGEYKQFTVGYEKNSTEDVKCKAFDYRVRIRINGELLTREYNSNDNTPYFEMEKNDKGEKNKNTKKTKHKASWTNDTVRITFLSKHEQLLTKIADNIEKFISVTNFGFRKGKGFGSYSITKIGNDKIKRSNYDYDKIINEIITKDTDKYEQSLYKIDFREEGNWLSVEQKIKEKYTIMKSGINFGRGKRSATSLLMDEYANSRNGVRYGNEKRRMKEKIDSVYKFNPFIINESKEKVDARAQTYPDDKYRYVRAMLGLADHYNFNHDEIYIDVRHVPNADDNITFEIKRFESPLLFKPIQIAKGWLIYIILRKIPKEMFGQTYEFEERKGNHDRFTLTTPSEEEFKLVEFMDVVAKHNIGIYKVE